MLLASSASTHLPVSYIYATTYKGTILCDLISGFLRVYFDNVLVYFALSIKKLFKLGFVDLERRLFAMAKKLVEEFEGKEIYRVSVEVYYD